MKLTLKTKLKLYLLIFIVIIIAIITLIELTLQPVLNNVCETEVSGMLTVMINQAVNKETDSISYNNLVTIQTNRQGHIMLMQPNLQIINDLSSNITLRIQKDLDANNNRSIKIPISQIFGVEILSDFAPKFKVNIIPYGSVKSNIIDSFEAVGINQTRHKIYLEVKTKIRVVIPLLSTDIKVDTEIPLTEAVIVGQVPEVYVALEDGLLKDGFLKRK